MRVDNYDIKRLKKVVRSIGEGVDTIGYEVEDLVNANNITVQYEELDDVVDRIINEVEVYIDILIDAANELKKLKDGGANE